MEPRRDGKFEGLALDTAQRFLHSAYASVESMLKFLTDARLARGASRGTNTDSEADLLRAAIVFCGAGLDAALKQLIRDALPSLIEVNSDASAGLNKFAQKIAAEPKTSAEAMLSGNPRQHIIDAYVYELTGSSLQSVEQVKGVAAALGISDNAFVKQISSLKDLFTARNEISHELDLRDVERHGEKRRRSRNRTETEGLADTAFEVGQAFIDKVGKILSA